MNGIWKLILRFVKLFLLLFFGLSIFWVVLYRFVNPPGTWLMITRGFERKTAGKDWKIDKEWRDFDDIADPMKRAAVAAEVGMVLVAMIARVELPVRQDACGRSGEPESATTMEL